MISVRDWFVATFLVLPWANATMSQHVRQMPARWFIEHLVYGGTLFLTAVFAYRHHAGELHISGAAHA